MTIELKPEHEQVIVQAIQAGLIHDAHEALDAALDALKNRLSVRRSETASAAKARAFEQWARNHPHNPPLPDQALRRENLVRPL